ncbi:MAG TPA: protein-methionine-sulfoxide reductase catalytic subunit MsrP [Bryobacterales bacterium]|jgi:sulfoxide reductase catalytic subunit YedY|nr:protein-methionine-sulfoxide reductase catalytic subunit MsrP [Bryobacterales bacterium]
MIVIRKAPEIRYSEITPKHVYLNRRRFLTGGAAALGVAAAWDAARMVRPGPVRAAGALNNLIKSPFSTTEKLTPYNDITHYNNFYEFGTQKDEPAKRAQKLRTAPWVVSVDGEVAKPAKYDLDTIMKMAPLEERIYRHRCVEAWSIVVPWIGFSLSALIKQVQPTSKAKYVAFQSFYDSRQMLLPMEAGIPFPYVEGLRMDEAMHPLTLLCVGLYGELLPKQNGAPVRLVVPWKYGFKSIKSIVRIRFVEKQPPATWNLAAPSEYGFYSNVNPEVDHPRWSQAKERRLGEFGKRKTLKFNGYGDQVASLYAGMDLRKYY